MSIENDKFKDMFGHFDGQWDSDEPAFGHQDRFLDRLENKKQKPGSRKLFFMVAMPAAAAIVVLLGLLFMFSPFENSEKVAKVSPKVKETQMYFASIIDSELAKVKKENSPETKVLVQDALLRMEQLDRDYDKITHELARKGESKQLIHAMITNLQTRIKFLEDVLVKIENIKKIKENYHENNQA